MGENPNPIEEMVKETVTTRSQMGYIVALAEKSVLTTQGGRFSPVDYKSHRGKRVARSTLAAETQTLDAAIDTAIFIRQLFAEICIGTLGKLDPDFLPVVALTDCRS
eukprot:3771308-Amphidinium_carterae.1